MIKQKTKKLFKWTNRPGNFTYRQLLGDLPDFVYVNTTFSLLFYKNQEDKQATYYLQHPKLQHTHFERQSLTLIVDDLFDRRVMI